MVIGVKLAGGVGNQLFQYCLGRRLADKNNDRLILDTSYYQRAKHCKYELDKFNIRIDQPIPEDSQTQFQQVQEQTMSFIPEVLELKGNILLQGYWQSPKYLEERIVKELDRIGLDHNGGIIAGDNGVAIHVRGGDYKGWKKFDVCTYEYYNKAYEIIKAKVQNPKFVVFTDDESYAKYLLYDISKKENLTYTPYQGREAIEHMNRCKHIIASNSTFAWWGYKLGYHGTSIFPSKWFNEEPGNNQHNEINLYEDQMILVEP